MQEVRRFKPSTVSRRISIVACFYRTCVTDQILASAPADHVRRPNVPPESPTLGLTHLQFEAMLTAARDPTNPNDFALVTMLGLLGLRISEATGAEVTDLGEEHGHRVLKVHGKGNPIVLVPLPPAVGRLSLRLRIAGITPDACCRCSEPPLRPNIGCQSRRVVNRVVPWTASSSFRSVSVNPTLASTRREAVFHSQTVAHRCSHPDDLAQSRTANEASVAYP
jgi:integrase